MKPCPESKKEYYEKQRIYFSDFGYRHPGHYTRNQFSLQKETHMYHTLNHRKTLTSLAVVVLTALMLCISLGAKPNSSQTNGFEYKVISRILHTMETLNLGEQKYPEARAEAIEMTLNNLGKKGWEFMEMNESFFILKRKLR
jgi:hypothetical protein